MCLCGRYISILSFLDFSLWMFSLYAPCGPKIGLIKLSYLILWGCIRRGSRFLPNSTVLLVTEPGVWHPLCNAQIYLHKKIQTTLGKLVQIIKKRTMDILFEMHLALSTGHGVINWCWNTMSSLYLPMTLLPTYRHT